MNILAINCGSSSIKSEIIDAVTSERKLVMKVSRIPEDQPVIFFSDTGEETKCPTSGHEAALIFALQQLREKLNGLTIQGIVHRVVHGGDRFQQPTLVTDEVLDAIREMEELAPLHNPVNLSGILKAQEIWPDLPHVVVFDTAFHYTMPNRAKTYALPADLTKKYGLRRFGFHGTSHSYVSRKAAKILRFPLRELRIITCHLGNGCSICAVEYGRSVETSMGMTPLEGLVMGTRSGDVDPGILIHLMKKENWSATDLDRVLNKDSGLKGIGSTNDMRDLQVLSAQGDNGARMAIQVFTHRVRKYIGAYAAVMGGVDAIVFTGGIGENSAVIRERIAQRLEFLGAMLNDEVNRDINPGASGQAEVISTSNSRCKLLVVPTDEQYEMVRQAAFIIEQKFAVKPTQLRIPVAVSARHVHLTQETIELLFGKGHELQVHKWLSQPGQYAAKEKVTLIGPKNNIQNVRVLGPPRSKNQVEISRTDEFVLGIDAPIRASGHVENTPGIKLVGPEGSIHLKQGVICAWRHIHMTPEDAVAFGVQDKDIVEVKIESDQRSLTFGNVLIRVKSSYALEMHIDTDEANAAELDKGAMGALVNTSGSGSLVKKYNT